MQFFDIRFNCFFIVQIGNYEFGIFGNLPYFSAGNVSHYFFKFGNILGQDGDQYSALAFGK